MSVYWLGLGFVSQFMFFLRFLIQWIETEKRKRVYIPDAFWYFSVLGGTGLLAYSLYRRDPVFIAGQFAGLLIYLRNIYFMRRHKNA